MSGRVYKFPCPECRNPICSWHCRGHGPDAGDIIADHFKDKPELGVLAGVASFVFWMTLAVCAMTCLARIG